MKIDGVFHDLGSVAYRSRLQVDPITPPRPVAPQGFHDTTGQRVMRTNNVDRSSPGQPVGPESMRAEIERGLESINRMIDTLNTRLSFRLHEETGRMVVRVIDLKTQQVIKQMPPEELLDLLGRIQEMVGLLIDERA